MLYCLSGFEIGDKMFKCHICGGTWSNEEYVSEVFVVDGRRVLIEKIPAQVCTRCGEATFSRTTTERVRNMVHSKAKPIAVVEMDVFAFA
jgi:HTH-type transcriptional regulator / antitoxin MqsA